MKSLSDYMLLVLDPIKACHTVRRELIENTLDVSVMIAGTTLVKPALSGLAQIGRILQVKRVGRVELVRACELEERTGARQRSAQTQ